MKDRWCKIDVKIRLNENLSLLNWVFKNISLMRDSYIIVIIIVQVGILEKKKGFVLD
jgi:hypothetical protein